MTLAETKDCLLVYLFASIEFYGLVDFDNTEFFDLYPTPELDGHLPIRLGASGREGDSVISRRGVNCLRWC
jgi:hypothetical protein